MTPCRTPQPKPPVQRADSPRPRNSGPLIYEVFKPKLPPDPFARLHTIREPWMLRMDSVAAAVGDPRRDVVLVLGAPTLKDISPVLQSPQFSQSLIILASHQLFPVPTGVRPAICTIRLNSSVTNEMNGTLRLAAVLQCAERVSRLWRKTGGSGVREISESETRLDASEIPDNLFLVPDSGSAQSSPSSSSEGLKSTTSSVRSFIIPAMSFLLSSSSSSPTDPSQRAFDAILNFIPNGISNVAIMKQTILITSLTCPFLAPASFNSTTSASKTRKRNILRRRTLPFSRVSNTDSYSSLQISTSTSATSDPGISGPLAKSRLLHILPLSGRAYLSQDKLVRNMESYQLSFAYPPSLSMKRPNTLERAVAFIVPATALREVVRHASVLKSSVPHSPYSSTTSSSSSVSSRLVRQAVDMEWTVADILLSGILDSQANPGGVPYAGPRAWICSGADFAFVAESEIESQTQSAPSCSSGTTPTTPDEMPHATNAWPDVCCGPSRSSGSSEPVIVVNPSAEKFGGGTAAVVNKRTRWRFWSSRGRVVTR
ncbi:hypothetical protein F5J12DRAFT_494444 [Pisolithus orientalis]|uniref:uncharacterized protein n=1 Tax=Pisolithus orientalis TaxID=936130 RepID=UPI002224A618|nr:uncharacterized protein F5J12DRAFT_494444 [Pisolithus orientalis]KAI6019911.1 hypothetical protein F5J12DRAFT_494444 [Pisolithus orientalis]